MQEIAALSTNNPSVDLDKSKPYRKKKQSEGANIFFNKGGKQDRLMKPNQENFEP